MAAACFPRPLNIGIIVRWMRYGRNTLDIAEAFGVPESVVWNILAASDGAP